MSASNNMVDDGIEFLEKKLKYEYFAHDFATELKTIMPDWKAWFYKMLQMNAKFCFIDYDKLKKNVGKELKPVLRFLGYKTNEELDNCILKNQEGDFHRPEKSKEEIDTILSLIPPGDLELYLKMKEDVLDMLKKASSC